MGRQWAVAGLLVCIAAGCALQAAARQPLPEMPPPHESVQTAYWFPKNDRKNFPAGSLSEVVVSLHNGATDPVNVSAIMGSLNSPFDFSFHVQNFSYQIYDVEVPAGAEVSLEYVFMPHQALQPREFLMALTAYYHTDKQLYSTTFFNGTVEITEPRALIDSQLLFLYVMVVAVLAGIGYVVYSYLAGAGYVKKPKKAKVVATPAGESDPAEWLKGTAYEAAQRKKAAAAAVKKDE